MTSLHPILASLKDEVEAVLSYTDASINEVLSGEEQGKDLWATRLALHRQALTLLGVID
jgi:hypothetical protein